MSKRDQPGMDVSVLLNDDGTVNHDAVKSITNAGTGGQTRVPLARCDELRRYVREGGTAADAAAEYGHGETAVARHIRGECHHLPSRLSEPPLEYVTGTGWVVDGEQGDA